MSNKTYDGWPSSGTWAANMTKYRINYGNGQVSKTFDTKRACLSELDSLCARSKHYAFMEFQDNGEWFAVKGVKNHVQRM